MHCPKCGFECDGELTDCPSCGVAMTVPGFDPNLGLVVVLETNDDIQLSMVKGLLEEAGIPYFILGQVAALVAGVDGFLKKWVRVQVARDREAEARTILDDWRQAAALPADSEGA